MQVTSTQIENRTIVHYNHHKNSICVMGDMMGTKGAMYIEDEAYSQYKDVGDAFVWEHRVKIFKYLGMVFHYYNDIIQAQTSVSLKMCKNTGDPMLMYKLPNSPGTIAVKIIDQEHVGIFINTICERLELKAIPSIRRFLTYRLLRLCFTLLKNQAGGEFTEIFEKHYTRNVFVISENDRKEIMLNFEDE